MTKNEIIDLLNSSPKIDRFVFWDKKTEDDDFDPAIASFERLSILTLFDNNKFEK